MVAPDTTDRPRQLRVLKLAIGLVIVEALLLVLAYLAPAMRVLLRPVYVVVAIIFAVAILHARGRNGEDRRHGERRHNAP
jgi:hypothetical protein